ncbi:MAG: aldo/keto reductase [Deltaproteobacteria bacterium]|jgi:aryl-alcohol dehydrogenase-like predicted oxidoreductase|nr:aldo/keto reductase [Deltaproteobacteria bacterium]MBW2159860.1 aldo/keto reductase [Deltaproteobacteria bacterium]MBW2686342.1 aldo/keto reductase [Deltaproteobacteria bacterium]
MHSRNLGDLSVSAVGFGAMVLSPGVYGKINDERAAAALSHALDAGVTMVDTADGYGGGHNETLVGRVIADRRDQVVVATKFGFLLPTDAEPHPFPVGFTFTFGELAVNGEPRFVRRYAEASLQRLGTDRIDLYYPHFPDPQVPIEDTVGAVAELVEDGLVRHIGLSNVTVDHLRRALGIHPIAAVQIEWSMWKPIEPDLLALCREHGVGIVAWSPLGAGFLAGTVTDVAADDFRQNLPRFAPDNLGTNVDRFEPIRRIAAELTITPAQLALAWLLHQDPRVVPIPGSRTPAHIDENLAAADVDLGADILERIDQELAEITPLGETLL